MTNVQKHVLIRMTNRQRNVLSLLVERYASTKTKNTKAAFSALIKRMREAECEEEFASSDEPAENLSENRKAILHLWKPLFIRLYREKGTQWLSLKTNIPQHVFQALESGLVVPTEWLATTIFRVYAIEKRITITQAKEDAKDYAEE